MCAKVVSEKEMECEVVKGGVVGESRCGDAKSDNRGQKGSRAVGSKSQTSKSRVSGSVGPIHEELQVAEGGQGVGNEAAMEEANIQWGEGVTWSMIEAEMESMKSLEVGEVSTWEEIREIHLDIGKVAEKIGRFRRTATVLQAIESAPTRDRVVEWVRDVIVKRRGAQVSQVKALSRREFLIVFESEAEKKLILEKPLCFLDGRVVRLVEWCSRKQERYADHLKAVWVELREVPPFLEDQVSLMLEALGVETIFARVYTGRADLADSGLCSAAH
ncbi:hypothetical protein R1sor_025948 [Riccia sorocarpa]|uniref:DUF4283 domain-containing protein n=1 Tax=Riccia sorocarpa TaxID=122646 RepID=A0ABD3GDA5_9MARC